MSTSRPFLPAPVQAALDQGNRLEAVRLLRERYDLGLKESMEVIAGIRRLPATDRADPAQQETVDTLSPVHTQAQTPPDLGTLVGAAFQALMGLKASNPSASSPERPTAGLQYSGLAPGEVPRSSGGWLLVLVVAAFSAYVFFR